MKRTLQYISAVLIALVLGTSSLFAAGNEGVILYPNPASEVLNIRLEDGSESISHVSLHNLLGQVVYEVDIDLNLDGGYIVEITDLPSGIYLVQVELTQGRTVVQRITKR